MPIRRIETLTADPDLVARAKLGLKAVHENGARGSFLNSTDLENNVVRGIVGNLSSGDNDALDAHIDALEAERKKFKELGVENFLLKNGFVVPLYVGAYTIPLEVAKSCPGLYE